MNKSVIERLNAALEARYRVERELGAGGMATVYLAEDLKHRRQVAVKVLKPELAAMVGGDRFLAEIETTANLQHPHILPLYDSGKADGFLFYVMPYVEGETLREKLQREGELPVEAAVSLVCDVAEALDYAHRQGVIHRDVKPANILMQEGRPVVADFGIALAVSAAGGGRLTETGLSLGTPHYMSPEQATADRVPGPASDVYSLSCVVYEMLTGRPPFPGPSAQAVLGQIIAGDPDPPVEHRRSIPPNVNGAVIRGLEKLPADRFPSAAELARALQDPAYRYGPVSDPAGAGGPWKAIAATAAVVAILALVLAGWSALGSDAGGEVTRYRISLPAPGNPAVGAGLPTGRFALSPDGRSLVFVGGGTEVTGLWLLDRSELDPVLFAETGTGAWTPFFSPDGEQVAFINDAGDILAKSATGGTTRTVASSVAGYWGGHWGSDGYLYFDSQAGRLQNGLGRVPAEGGPVEAATVPDTAVGDNSHAFPHVLPDGRTLLYTSLGHRGPRIMAADLETGETSEVTAGLQATYIEPGYLVWATEDGTLLAANFDVGGRSLGQAPVTVAEDVSFAGNIVHFTTSESGTLIYATGTGGALGEPTWIDRNGTARVVDPGWEFPVNNFFQSVALSPDEDRLVVSIQGPTLDLWIKELDEGPLSRLTFEGPTNFRARWFPDGRRVIFSSDRGPHQQLWSKPTDGTGSATVLAGGVDANHAEVSPDGEWVVYREARDLRAQRLNDPDGEALELVATGFDELSPAVSRDGRWLAYSSNETGRDEIYVRPFPDPSGGRWQVSTNGGTEPYWSRDGTELYYRDGDLNMIAVELVPGEAFRTGRQQTLFSTREYWANRFQRVYDVASDGRFLMMRQGGASDEESVVLVENLSRELEERLGR